MRKNGGKIGYFKVFFTKSPLCVDLFIGLVYHKGMENEERRKRFKSAQNMVALLLFTLFAGQTVCSFPIVGLQLLESHISYEAYTYLYTGVTGFLYLIYMLLPLVLASFIGKRSFLSFAKWRGKTHKPVATALFCLGIMYVGQLAASKTAMLFERLFGVDIYASLPSYHVSGVGFLLLSLLCTAVFPAFLEEMLMRGAVLSYLMPYGKSFAVIMCGCLFGLMHLNPIQLPFACIAGIAMAYVTVETGNIRTAVAVHFVNNSLSVIMTYLQNEMSPAAYGTLGSIVDITVFALGALSCLYLIRGKKSLADPAADHPSVDVRETEKVELDKKRPLFNLSLGMAAYLIFAAGYTLFTLGSLLLNTVLLEFL